MFNPKDYKLFKTGIGTACGFAIATFSLVLYPSYSSAETDYFVGAGVGYQNDRLDGAGSENGEDAFVQLHAGAIIDSNHKVAANYSYKDKFSQSLYYVSYDYLYGVSNRVSLNGGFLLGVGYNDIQSDSSVDFVRGLQVGTSIKISNDWSTDVTYRYIHQDYEENEVEIDNTQQVVIMANYHF
ncbi:porin family protein [Photobacterium sanctipauli]|uniref:Porin family protein n=1 Tax=Photobacterium sanctipauli TaxID=1342794 RepID=A0A2T3NWC7_9GAMM|nr:outer membrane beta-barrel protein [Photobacterium sanctipauli]PSW20590.1 porin family protein [Photobacterium sanctipauli]